MQNVLIDMQILSCLVEVLLIFLAPVEMAFIYTFISIFLIYKYVFIEEPGIPGFIEN